MYIFTYTPPPIFHTSKNYLPHFPYIEKIKPNVCGPVHPKKVYSPFPPPPNFVFDPIIAYDVRLGTYLLGGWEGVIFWPSCFFPLGLVVVWSEHKKWGEEFFALLGVVGGSAIPGPWVVIYDHSKPFTKCTGKKPWVGLHSILLYRALVNARPLSKVKINKNVLVTI